VAGGAVVLLLLYVDDIIIAASTAELANHYAKLILTTFRVSSEGPLTTYLGIDVEIDLTKRKVELCMAKFMEKVFRRFKLVAKQSASMPEGIMEALECAEPADPVFVDDFEYREKVGCIMYYMTCMRPDVCFAVGLVARHVAKISKVAAAGVSQLLQYLYNTRHRTLMLGGIAAYIKAFCDSDWAGDRANRRSTGAFILYLGDGPVEWSSKQHRLVAQSTAEAEYIALNAPAKSILWLRWLLAQTGITALITHYSSTIFSDNTAAENIANNPLQSDKTKHIAIKYHFVRELVEAGVLVVEHVDTLLNVADIGTKPLGKRKFEPLADIALGHGELVKPTKRRRTERSDEFV
jgi:hypothetical protein